MKLSEFRFDLPQNLIALNPTENREDARMMVVNRKNKTIEHKKFTDIIDYFGEGDVLVTNNTKVFLHVYTVTKRKQELKSRSFY